VGKLQVSFGDQAQDWLDRTLDTELGRTVAIWLYEVLLDEDADVDVLPITSNTGQRRYVSRVPGTRVDVTWLEAAPFRTIKVLWIEQDEG
jgi:hypothetical protein